MKDFKELSWQVDEPTYRADEAFSYSTIARFNREGFNGLSKLYDKVESPSLTFGTAVDTLTTGTLDEFNEIFYVATFPEMSDQLQTIAKVLIDRFAVEKTFEEITDEELATIGEECGYYKGASYKNTRVKKIKSECAIYYNLAKNANGRIIVNAQFYNDALECANAFKTSENTYTYFNKDPFTPNIKNYYQLKFKGTYEGINLRCMADVIQVDYEKKTVQPIDVKTSFHKEWEFADSFIKWNYYIQAQLYWYIIRQNMDNDEEFKDFKLLDYKFIVISNSSRHPLVWEYLDTQVDHTVYYGRNKQYVCKNWREIVTELSSYTQSQPEIPHGFYNKRNEVNDIIYWLNE